MDDAIGRALHVLRVVLWIGGVGMVTAVILPWLRSGGARGDRVAQCEAIEKRFTWVAGLSILLVGLSGFHLVFAFDLWDRFLSPGYWWMHAMVLIWLVFATVVFLAEPLYLHRAFRRWASVAPEEALTFLARAHWVLLILSLVTVLGAVAGSHGAPF